MSDEEEASQMMIRPDEEQHENIPDYDVEDGESGEDIGEEGQEDDEEDDENCIEIDERTLIAIIKV